VPTVEVRIPSAHVVARMDVRRWLRDRGCVHSLTPTGSRDERVVLVEFITGTDAAEFARRLGGTFGGKIADCASYRRRLRQTINCASVLLPNVSLPS